jgi:uncharacterized protein (DUF3820 family)
MEKLTDNSLMSFGIHKGTKLANLQAEYLLFIYDNYTLQHNLKAYIEENLDGLKAEKKRADRAKYK